jgi:non-homologous end joining protein Ku
MARSIWNGAVPFDGIDVPVKVIGAADDGHLGGREIRKGVGTR